jgi:DNA-binding IclR family transcriptional regulator
MNAYQIPSLSKACRLLAWLASAPDGRTVSSAAREIQIPRTTAFRVLRTLCSEGLVEDVDGKYRVGPGLVRLGLLALQSVEIPARAEPVLQRLAQATGETAHLAVRAGEQMLIVQVADSPHPIRAASRPGALVAMHCAAAGKAFLAALPQPAVADLLERLVLERRTSRTLTTVTALEAELKKIRRQAYAVDNEEYYEGVRCLAVAVHDAHGDAVGALGVTAAASRFTNKRIPEIADAVTSAARTLSQALGQPDAGQVT